VQELLGSETTAVRFIQRLKDRRNEFNTLRFARDVKIGLPKSADATAYRKSDVQIISVCCFLLLTLLVLLQQSNVKFLAPANKKSKKQAQQQNKQQQQRELDRIEANHAEEVVALAELEESRKVCRDRGNPLRLYSIHTQV